MSCKYTWMGRRLSRDNFADLGGAICGVDISPISKRENLWGVAWTLAWVFS